jgi:hypothetical protein
MHIRNCCQNKENNFPMQPKGTEEKRALIYNLQIRQHRQLTIKRTITIRNMLVSDLKKTHIKIKEKETEGLQLWILYTLFLCFLPRSCIFSIFDIASFTFWIYVISNYVLNLFLLSYTTARQLSLC